MKMKPVNLSDAEIAARIEAIKAYRRSKTTPLTTDDVDAVLGPPEPARAAVGGCRRQPACADSVRAAAAAMARPGEWVSIAAVARRLNLKEHTARRAVKHLVGRGRWPYVVARNEPKGLAAKD